MRASATLLGVLSACGGVTDPWSVRYSGGLTGEEDGVRAAWFEDPGVIEPDVFRLSIDLYADPAERRGPFADPRISVYVLDYLDAPVLEAVRIWGTSGDTPCTPVRDGVVLREVGQTLDLDVTATVTCPELPGPDIGLAIDVRSR